MKQMAVKKHSKAHHAQPTRRRKPQHRRRTFMFDRASDKDLQQIQYALRATTASEALRFSVRKLCELIQQVSAGAEVHVIRNDGSQVKVDLP